MYSGIVFIETRCILQMACGNFSRFTPGCSWRQWWND